MRRMGRGLIVAAMTAALAACVAIPTSGPVNEGDTEVAQPGPFVPILEGPAPGAGAREIVQGFLAAAAGGTISGFDVAREFLSQEAAAAWDPLANVVVYDSRQVVPDVDEVAGTFTYSLPVAADVDAAGIMTEAATDVRRDIQFSVGQVDGGEYRITELADGVVMSSADFSRFYRAISLSYATIDGDIMVPELRWFANNPQVSTAVAGELIAGPSAWLADAVRSGFPPGSALDVDAVVVEDGLATVSLAPGSAGTAQERTLVGRQLRSTLLQLSNVQAVEATIGVLPLGDDGESLLPTAPLPAERAAVIAEGRLGFFDGTTVVVTPVEDGVVPADATGLSLGYDGVTVAFLSDGDVWTSDALAVAETMEPFVASGARAESDDTVGEVLVQGADLVAPSFDPRGWLWTTETQSHGDVVAVLADGTRVDLQAPWLAGRTVQAVAVSRDGARLAVLSRAGEQQSLDVAAIVRDADGVPLSLGTPLATGASLRPSVDLSWADDITVVSLGEAQGETALTQVGGWTTELTPVAGATVITARNGERTMLTVSADGWLMARSGTGWAQQVQGIADIAYAG